MLKNYFKIAVRNLFRNKMFSVINILGLATAIACCLLISLYVFNETSYDRFHKNADKIVRVTMEFSTDGKPNNVSVTGTKVLPALRRDFPEVKNGVRMYPVAAVINYGSKTFDEKAFVYADSTVFNVFSFNLLQGDPQTVLNKPNTVVLTASSAKKYFGKEDPIGKVVRINNEKDFAVTGVVADVPANSQIKFDFLASFYSLPEDVYKEENWWDASYYTYLLLENKDAAKTLGAKIPGYMKTQEVNKNSDNSHYLTLHLEPLKDVHLYSTVEGGFEPGSDYRYIYVFSVIALLILIIACFNYINLTTARAVERAKEVGLRKVMGAFRKQLLGQFMGESIITVIIALLLSIPLVSLLLPVFNILADKQLQFSSVFQPFSIIILAGIVLIIGFMGGSYPAFILSGFNPVKVLKGNFKASTSGIWLRKGLLVFQFIISVGLIISALIIRGQLTFIQNKKLGYNKDHIIVLPLDKFIQKNISALKTEFLGSPNVSSITSCNQLPTFVPGKYNLTVDKHEMIVTAVRTDKDFIKTLELRIINGSDFTDADQMIADSTGEKFIRPLIINEAAARSLGWTNDEAIGKTIKFQGRNSVIKGIVNDFHFSSMHESITPFVIFLNSNTKKILVRLSGKQIPETVEFLKAKWKAIVPHRPFEYSFLDDQFNKLYTSETRTGKLFYVFALLAIGLACLGLFGLVAFSSQQRTKEIGIRKVLGANIGSIVLLLSKNFLKMVVIACLVAFPLAWWAMNKWLESFAYRIQISWWVFAMAGVAALLIALLTMSFQAIKAAISNPIKSLRTE